MEEIYDDLWLTKRVIVKNFTIPVPQPHLIRHEPGYGIDPGRAVTEEFPGPEFTENVQEEEFKALDARALLLCGTNTLLVRAEYEKIERLLEVAVWQRWSDATNLPERGANLDFKISGQCGSGKSVFLSYILARRLARGQPTVYREDDRNCFLFNRNSAGKQVNADTLFRLPMEQQRQLWILTNELPTDPRWSGSWGWFLVLAEEMSTILVTSSIQWETDRNVGVHCMSSWEWGEMLAAFSLRKPEPPTRSEILKLYTTFACLGPVARPCLRSIPNTTNAAYYGSLVSDLMWVDYNIQTFISRGAYKNILASISGPLAHKPAVMEPREFKLFRKVGIETRWMAHRALMVGLEQSPRIGFGLYLYFSRHQALRRISGWYFEGCVQYVLSQGGSFHADPLPLPTDKSTPLQFGIQTNYYDRLHYFESPGHLAQQVQAEDGCGIAPGVIGKYFLPHKWSPESIDGLVFSHLDTVILLRITIANRLTIDPEEIEDLVRALPTAINNIRLVFVVPQAHTGPDFKQSSVPAAIALISDPCGLSISQFELVCTYKDMHAAGVHRQLRWYDGVGGGY